MTGPIGWYVHHHGRGHLHRAQAVTAALRRRGVEVTILSSLPPEPWAPWVELPRDDDEGRTAATPGSRLHFAPVDSRGHRERLARVAAWVARERPRLAVVDVSVELTVWLRTQGVPTAAFAMPGDRDDAPHELAYDLADRVIAPWPGDLMEPAYLARRADKVAYVGGISRYADRRPGVRRTDSRDVLLLGGAGGSGLTSADLAAARAATPGWHWRVAGPLGTWHDDVWPLLTTCDVAVIAAGQNSVADAAAAHCRTIVIPEDRPFGEQRATAEALAAGGLAVVRDTWPTASGWPAVLAEAAALEPRWERWHVEGAADRAATALVELADRFPGVAP